MFVSYISKSPFFEPPDLYWRSPESGDLWYKSGGLKTKICSHSESW